SIRLYHKSGVEPFRLDVGVGVEAELHPAGSAGVMGNNTASKEVESNGLHAAMENNGAAVGEVSSVGTEREAVTP
ncbi:hypothetical protein PIB30_101846, partial [Stylosanthes scabra]|nr:hypothetical protein [Stylosanthes scabra]